MGRISLNKVLIIPDDEQAHVDQPWENIWGGNGQWEAAVKEVDGNDK